MRASKIYQTAKVLNTISLEAQLDARVAHLYNLPEEEYSLILNKTNCTDQIRNAKTSARSMW